MAKSEPTSRLFCVEVEFLAKYLDSVLSPLPSRILVDKALEFWEFLTKVTPCEVDLASESPLAKSSLGSTIAVIAKAADDRISESCGMYGGIAQLKIVSTQSNNDR